MELVRLLLAGSAAANDAGPGGATPLHEASAKGLPLMVRLLLQHGADANALKEDGETPLSAAALHGHAGCIALLLGAGARDAPFDAEAPAGRPRASAFDAAMNLAAGSPQHAACVQMLLRCRVNEQPAPPSLEETTDDMIVSFVPATIHDPGVAPDSHATW